MIVEDQKTAHLELPLPAVVNDQDDDCLRIAQAFRKLDAHAKTTDAALAARLEQASAADDAIAALQERATATEQAQAVADAAMTAQGQSLQLLSTSLTAEADARAAADNAEATARQEASAAHDADAEAHAVLIKRVVMGDNSPIIGVVEYAGGGGVGVWQHVDGEGRIINPPRRYFDFHPVFSGLSDRVILDGQVMQRHSKFGYKTFVPASGELAGKTIRLISPAAGEEGFAPFPSFFKLGQEIDHWYCATYSATDDGGTPKKLGSKPGRPPFVNVDFPTMRSYAHNRNVEGVEGFDLWNIWQVAELQYLFLLEHACPDSQGLIGRGRVDYAWDGTTSNAANVDADDVAQATYRGHVGLWGNVWAMVAGIEIDTSGHVRLWNTDGSKEYVTTDFILPAYNGTSWQYPASTKKGSGEGYDFNVLFLPETQTPNLVDGMFPDYFWGRYGTAGNVMYLGGSWELRSGAGLFCQNLNNPQSNRNLNIGGRLAKA